MDLNQQAALSYYTEHAWDSPMPPLLSWCSHHLDIRHFLTFPHGHHLPTPCKWPSTVLHLLCILAFDSQISSIIVGNVSDPANNQSSSQIAFISSLVTHIYYPTKYHPIILHPLTTTSNHPNNCKFLLILLSVSSSCLTFAPLLLPRWFRSQ